MEKTKTAKIGRVISNVILYVCLAVCICTLLLTLFAKREAGATEIFGYQMRIVTSSSMEASEHTDVSDFDIKSIPIRSLVFIETVPEDEAEAAAWYEDLKEGDVLTFRYVYVRQETITHRITYIDKNGNGGYTITLEGDNKSSEDGRLTQIIDTSVPYSTNYVIGKVVGQSKLVGAAMSFLKENPVAMGLIVILPCLLIILFEAIKIVKVVGESKRAEEKKAQDEEKQVKEDEIAELRRRLAELEKGSEAQGKAENEPLAETAAETKENEEIE